MSKGLDLKAMIKALKVTDHIITPRYQDWLIHHGNEEFPQWVVDIIAAELAQKPRVRSATFSSSSAGRCLREQALQFIGAPQAPIGHQLQNIFNDGKWRHLRWQACLLTAGILTDIEEKAIWPKMRARGTMDGIGIVPDDHARMDWRGEEFGFELKGVSGFMYPKLKDQGPKEEDHLQQVGRYFLKTGYRLFVIIYEDKSTQDWSEWVIDSESEQMQEIMAKQKEELVWLNDSAEKKKLPLMLPSCAKGTGTKWNNCPMGGRGGPCDLAGDWPTP